MISELGPVIGVASFLVVFLLLLKGLGTCTVPRLWHTPVHLTAVHSLTTEAHLDLVRFSEL